MDTENIITQSMEHKNAHHHARTETQAGPSRPLLYLVPPTQPSGATAIWQGDPDLLSPEGTSLRDWPTARAFAPLIAAATRAGDTEMAKQLRADLRYCAAMRRKIRQTQAESRQIDGKPN